MGKDLLIGTVFLLTAAVVSYLLSIFLLLFLKTRRYSI